MSDGYRKYGSNSNDKCDMEEKTNCTSERPLVSAIITTHNRKELLKRAVESVKAQTYQNIELIVVDDKSDDGTRQWCESQDFRYIYIPPEQSRGGNYARNLGAEAARGKYLAFLDDDDYWLPEKTAKQVELLETSGNEVAHCWRKLEIINDDSNSIIEDLPLPRRYRGDLSRRILYQISVFTSAMMVKKTAFLETGGFDEKCRFWQEYELTIRLAQRKPFELMDDYGMVYRINTSDPGRLTNKYEGWKQSVEYIYTKHQKLFSQLNIFERIRVKVLYWTDSASRAQKSSDVVTFRRHQVLNKVIGFPFRAVDKIIRLIRG